MEVKPFNRERELLTAQAFFGGEPQETDLVYFNSALLYIDYNEIPIQRDMERNPEERKP